MIQHQATMLPVMRPQLPTADELLPYLRRIDEARIYSNFGPLHEELSERLALHFGVGVDQIALVANGTLALQAAVETVGDIGDTWVLPSWTFVATGQAVLSARRRLHFVDVDSHTWAIPAEPRDYSSGHMVVAPFGSKPDVSGWVGVPGPKVFDAASCFDACEGIGRKLDDRTMLMVSLHATKSLPAGEGGVLVGPPEWIQRAVSWANFGFSGSRVASGPGLNAKMSEYHAAIGLSSLDSWSADRAKWRQSLETAVAVSSLHGFPVQPSFRAGHVTSTWNVVLPEGLSLDVARRQLSREGIETRSWWPVGVQRMPTFERCTASDLSVTDELVQQVLGLPFSLRLRANEWDLISSAMEKLKSLAPEFAA